MRIVNISIQAENADSLREAASELKDSGIDVDIFDADYRNLEKSPELFEDLVRHIGLADMVVIRCMAEPTRFSRYSRLEPVLEQCRSPVFLFSGAAEMRPLYRDVFDGTDRDYGLLCQYLMYKGKDNEKGLILWLNERLGGPAIPVPAPVIPRQDGIYHPDCDPDISLDEYVRRLDPSRPTAGIVMTQTDWMSGNTEHIDAFIRGLEEKGMNTIPIFYSHLAPPEDGEKGLPIFIKKYFMHDGRPRIDVLLLTISSSNLVHSKKGEGTGFDVEISRNFYKTIADVPVIQALCVHNKWEDFEEDKAGLDKHDITILVIRPELDGQIMGVPIGCIGKDGGKKLMPLAPGIDHVSRMALNWATLRRKKPEERKIAIIMYQPRDDSSCIGSSGGLDVQESVCGMLRTMSEAGYRVEHVPHNGDELVQELLKGVTNDLNWISPKEAFEKAAGVQGPKEYGRTFRSVPRFNQERLVRSWGEPPGEVTVLEGNMIMPGVENGNILITYQPIRALGEQTDALYHDPVIPAPHQYLGFYRWLKDVYHADAVIHMGTHGSMEWLPGKSVGLSNKCEPDMILDTLPDIYPFCIDDPGEGIQAKRRVEAVIIAYLNPAMARADSYEDLEKICSLLREYFTIRGSASEDRMKVLVSEIFEEARRQDLLDDLHVPEDTGSEEFEQYIVPLHGYLEDVKDALIPDGLHVLGRIPSDRHMDECVYSISRIRNGDIPSLRGAFASACGIDLDDCLQDPSGSLRNGELKSVAAERVDSDFRNALREMREAGYGMPECKAIVERYCRMTPELEGSLEFALSVTVPNLLRTDMEMDNLMTALDGRYVPPGPSGPPTRGNARILPSGRNFYGIDPDSVPTVTAWEIGKRMADQMLQRFLDEKGHYPHEIGMVIWATDTMKTNGDDVGYILWLMGVRPVWSKTGDLVNGLEVIPLEELGRPRIDVTLRITGLFRDCYPNLVDMFNDALDLVADLDESEDENYIADNVRKDVAESIGKGIPVDEAQRSARIRVFGSAPGSYGGGVDVAIASGAWKNTEDLADVCLNWSSYAYGRGMYGELRKEEFSRRFSRVSATIKNMPDREHDILAMDEVFEYMGGLNAFVRAHGDKDAMFLIGDDSDPDRSRLRTANEECQFIFRSKVLNPKWLAGIKEHGYRGAQELSKLAEYMIGWDGTTGSVDDWMYQKFSEKFIFDEETRKWLEEKNPFALSEMLQRMQEAIDRDLWDADEETREKLKKTFLENEELIEGITDRDAYSSD